MEQNYICHIPDGVELSKAAPLMCAGTTLYSPLKRWGAGPGKQVAIIGMGGLGHMGVKLAAAMGAEVSVISRTMAKREDGLRFGASHYYAMSDPATAKQLRRTFDLIITTVSADEDIVPIIEMLKTGGVLVDVGLPENPVSLPFGALIGQRRVLAGSQIGGIAETQEMLDFCGEHGITPEIELIGGADITDAYPKVVGSKVRYRYVIDTSTF